MRENKMMRVAALLTFVLPGIQVFAQDQKADYGILDTWKPERLSAATKEIQAGPQKVVVRAILFQSSRFVGEIVYSNAKVDDKELIRLVEIICDFIKREY